MINQSPLWSSNNNISGEEALTQFDNYYTKLQEIYKDGFLETIDLNGSTHNFFHF